MFTQFVLAAALGVLSTDAYYAIRNGETLSAVWRGFIAGAIGIALILNTIALRG